MRLFHGVATCILLLVGLLFECSISVTSQDVDDKVYTINGRECSFPTIYRGQVLNSCTMIGGESRCKTVSGHWETCVDASGKPDTSARPSSESSEASNTNGGVTIRVDKTSIQSGDMVKVTVENDNPTADDWVGAYSPGIDVDVSRTSPVKYAKLSGPGMFYQETEKAIIIYTVSKLNLYHDILQFFVLIIFMQALVILQGITQDLIMTQATLRVVFLRYEKQLFSLLNQSREMIFQMPVANVSNPCACIYTMVGILQIK